MKRMVRLYSNRLVASKIQKRILKHVDSHKLITSYLDLDVIICPTNSNFFLIVLNKNLNKTVVQRSLGNLKVFGRRTKKAFRYEVASHLRRQLRRILRRVSVRYEQYARKKYCLFLIFILQYYLTKFSKIYSITFRWICKQFMLSKSERQFNKQLIGNCFVWVSHLVAKGLNKRQNNFYFSSIWMGTKMSSLFSLLVALGSRGPLRTERWFVWFVLKFFRKGRAFLKRFLSVGFSVYRSHLARGVVRAKYLVKLFEYERGKNLVKSLILARISPFLHYKGTGYLRAVINWIKRRRQRRSSSLDFTLKSQFIAQSSKFIRSFVWRQRNKYRRRFFFNWLVVLFSQWFVVKYLIQDKFWKRCSTVVEVRFKLKHLEDGEHKVARRFYTFFKNIFVFKQSQMPLFGRQKVQYRVRPYRQLKKITHQTFLKVLKKNKHGRSIRKI